MGISKIQVWSTQLFGQVDRQVVTLHCSNSRAGKNLRGVHCTMSQTLQKKCIFHTFWYSYECNRLKSACGVKKNFRKYDLWDESVYHFQTPWLFGTQLSMYTYYFIFSPLCHPAMGLNCWSSFLAWLNWLEHWVQKSFLSWVSCWEIGRSQKSVSLTEMSYFFATFKLFFCLSPSTRISIHNEVKISTIKNFQN